MDWCQVAGLTISRHNECSIGNTRGCSPCPGGDAEEGKAGCMSKSCVRVCVCVCACERERGVSTAMWHVFC
jgi:hypothetical protein